MIAEQREDIRLQPNGSAFAVIGCEHTRVGKIKDINLTGLSFEYICDQNISHEEASHDSSEVDIFLAGDVFQLYSISCNLIYDIPINQTIERAEHSEYSIYRRCGVQFNELTDDNLWQLKFFLDSYTHPTNS